MSDRVGFYSHASTDGPWIQTQPSRPEKRLSSTPEGQALQQIGVMIGVPDDVPFTDYPRYVNLVVNNLEWYKQAYERLKAAEKPE